MHVNDSVTVKTVGGISLFDSGKLEESEGYCSLSILYNSIFILMATSLGTNAVIVMRVHCISHNLVITILNFVTVIAL